MMQISHQKIFLFLNLYFTFLHISDIIDLSIEEIHRLYAVWKENILFPVFSYLSILECKK